MLTTIAKLYYHQARPFWVSPEIQAFSCVSQYGNPSGHCFTTCGMSFAVWLNYKSPKWYVRAIYFALVVAFVAAIGYSRLFLGDHSINQVALGLQLGLWFALTSEYILREPLEELSRSLIQARASDIGSKAWNAAGLLIAFFIVQAVNYQVSLSFVNPPEWSE